LEKNWAWGLALIVLTIAIHGLGVALMALAEMSFRLRIERRHHLRLPHVLAIATGLIGVAGLLLAALHGMEAALWAAAYSWLGALNSPADAILYSVDTIATRGASGVTLERPWGMMGALEAVDGMLLFGISTAYIFAVMQSYWPFIIRHLRHAPT